MVTMAQLETNSTPRRRRRQTKRSRMGCRTCRCDETPGGCTKRLSKRFKCQGSDLDRLPNKAAAGQGA
ncbi:hypothetical protein RU639_001553 [Aspergillus parasiticus]